MELGTEEAMKQRSAFDFFDFINNMYVVIHCIKTLAIIFKVDIQDIQKIECSTECFEEPGLTGKGTDYDFFEYVRSLISVHPVETSMHPEYNGYSKVHCSPFTVWTMDKHLRDADLSVHIYTSEKDGDIQTLQLWVYRFEKYLQRWIDFIDVIVDAVYVYNDEKAADYKNQHIKTEHEFDSYDAYLRNLREELVVRVGEYTDYLLEYYAKVFTLKMSHPENNHKFELYKNAIKYSIGFLHQRLQHMDNDEITNTGIFYPERGLETELYIELWKPHNIKSEISKYGYELEKLHYIDGSGSLNEEYGRRLMEKIKPLINKYVRFTNEEPAFETHVLVSMALYFESFGFQNLINRNIPNTLDYREVIVPSDEWKILIMNEKVERPTEDNRLRKFMLEHDMINKNDCCIYVALYIIILITARFLLC